MPDKIGGAHMAMLVTNQIIEEFVDMMATHSGDDFQISESGHINSSVLT